MGWSSQASAHTDVVTTLHMIFSSLIPRSALIYPAGIGTRYHLLHPALDCSLGLFVIHW